MSTPRLPHCAARSHRRPALADQVDGQRWLLLWKVGARISQAFFDSRATGAILEQRTSDFYLGAGPHLGVDLRRSLGGTGFELFGRAVDGTAGPQSPRARARLYNTRKIHRSVRAAVTQFGRVQD